MVGRLTPGTPHVLPSPAEASRAVADRLVELARDALTRSDRFTLAVSGGRTPEMLFDDLGSGYARSIPWSKTQIYFADERAVPPEDPRSNFGLLARSLIQRLSGGPMPTVHRIEAERAPTSRAASDYETKLRVDLGGRDHGPPSAPTFDAILLGVGADGHTASLFPGAPSLAERERWAIVEPQPHLDPKVPRVSLTLPVISASRRALFLACGAEKREILGAVFEDPRRGTPEARLPSGRVTARDGVEWYLDAAAAPAA